MRQGRVEQGARVVVRDAEAVAKGVPDVEPEAGGSGLVRLLILKVALSLIEGEFFWGRSTDPSHPSPTFSICERKFES